MPKVLSEYEEEYRPQKDEKETLRRVEKAKGQSLECRLIKQCARRRIAPFLELVGEVTRDVDRRQLIRAERRAEDISAVSI